MPLHAAADQGDVGNSSAMSEPRNSSLRHIAMRGVGLTATAQAIRVIANLALTIWLARLLSPDQFGVVAMAAPVTAFALLLQNLSLDQAIVQSRSIEQRTLTTLFWFNLAVTAAVAGAVLLAGAAVGAFYGDVRAGHYVMASSFTVGLAGPALIHNALLNRDLRFGALAVVDLASTGVTVVTTIVAAYLLRNFWALWIGATAAATVSLGVLWSIHNWRPTGRPAVGSVGSLFGFAGYLTGFNLVNFFARNADNILIARGWGATAVGNYDRAYKLMFFPIQNINAPLSRVTLPVLAKIKDNPVQFRRTYMITVRGLIMAVVPGSAVAGATSERLIPFLLGNQWGTATLVFKWLAIAALLQPFLNALGWLFITSQRSRAMFQWGVFASATMILAFLAGLPWGPVGVAQAYCAANFLLAPLLVIAATRSTPVSLRDALSLLLPTLAGSAVAWALISLGMATAMPLFLLLAAGLTMAYGMAIAANYAFADGREIVAIALSALRQLGAKPPWNSPS